MQHVSDELPQWAQILRQCGVVERHHDAGEVLLRQGVVGGEFLVVSSGHASVIDARTSVRVATVGPLGIVGELSLLTRRPRRHTVVADEHLHAWHGDLEAFTAALDHDEIRTHFGQVAARRLGDAVEPVRFTARDGSELLLRPLMSSDREAYVAALDAAPTDTLMSRFFTPVRPPPAVVEHLLDIDFVRHVAWVVTDGAEPEGGLGLGRFIADEQPGAVELAVTVLPDARGKGLGSTLVGAVATSAAIMGYETMIALVLGDNRPMRGILDKCGAGWTTFEPGVVRTELPNDHIAATLTPDLRHLVAAASYDLSVAATLALA